MLRPHDLLGRLGGEEFAIFMTDIDANTAYQAAENIRKELAKHLSN
jgi:PleD family two-component response regulator